jgi:hypothetical protein
MTAVKQKTARIQDAPGCMGSPTIRAIEAPACKTCVFRDFCKEQANLNLAIMQEYMGPIQLPKVHIERNKISDGKEKDFTPTGETLSPNAEALRKDLNRLCYSKTMMKNVIETGDVPEGFKGGKTNPWVIPALKAIHHGVPAKHGLRDIILEHSGTTSLTPMMAAGKARLFASILLHWGIAQNKDGMIVKGDSCEHSG